MNAGQRFEQLALRLRGMHARIGYSLRRGVAQW